MISTLLSILIFLTVWAFFAGSETAFISSDRIKLKNMERKGIKSAKIALFLIEKPQRLLTTVLIGTNISLVFAANLTARLFYQLYGRPRPLSSVVSITILSLILCEMLPKNIAFKNNIAFTRIAAYPILIFYFISYPVVLILSVITRFLIKIIGIEYTGLLPSLFKEKEDVKIFFRSGIGKELDDDQTRYFVDSLDFGSKRLADVQIPLVEIKAISYNSSIADALNFIKKTHKSIIPIFKDRIDNIVGFVLAHELLGKEKELSIDNLVREPQFVPETKLINELYRDMFIHDIPVVFGVDEHGGVTGLATIYDIGEEVIGKINTIEEKKKLIVRIGDNEYLLDGDVEIDEINHILDLDLQGNGVTTLNGLITKELGRIPKKGDAIKFDNCIITVEKSSKKRAELLKVKKVSSVS